MSRVAEIPQKLTEARMLRGLGGLGFWGRQPLECKVWVRDFASSASELCLGLAFSVPGVQRFQREGLICPGRVYSALVVQCLCRCLPVENGRNIQASSSDYMSDGSARHWSREQAVGPAATATEGFLY